MLVGLKKKFGLEKFWYDYYYFRLYWIHSSKFVSYFFFSFPFAIYFQSFLQFFSSWSCLSFFATFSKSNVSPTHSPTLSIGIKETSLLSTCHTKIFLTWYFWQCFLAYLFPTVDQVQRHFQFLSFYAILGLQSLCFDEPLSNNKTQK